MNSIESSRLRLIGKLIKVYREELKNEKNRDFTMQNFCNLICSLRTLSRLENGEYCKNREIYSQLLDKLGLELYQYPQVDDAIKNSLKGLYEAIEIYDKSKIIMICNKNLKVLEHIKRVVYYSELYALFANIKQYYANDLEISIKTMKRYIRLIRIFPPEYSSLLRIMIFSRLSLIVMLDINQYKQNVDEISLLNDDLPCVRMLMLHYYYVTSQYICMRELSEELIKIFRNENNAIRLLDVYNYTLYLYSKIDINKRNEIRSKIDELINENDIPSIKISEIYANIGVLLYEENSYEEALGYFEIMILKTKDIYLPHLLYMANCQRHLNKVIKLPEIEPNMLLKYSTELQFMYKYYSNFYELKPFDRQNIIIKKIAPHLKDPDLISIFRYEMFRVVEETNSYKYLYLFEKILKES